MQSKARGVVSISVALTLLCVLAGVLYGWYASRASGLSAQLIRAAPATQASVLQPDYGGAWDLVPYGKEGTHSSYNP